jgi:GT2 family glycosyltransferase
MTDPLISICIVNWNCRDLLRACLASCDVGAADLGVETIVVDNASADGAADLVASEFPHVRLIRNAANVGFARANNQAAAVARGRYLFFLNNDTVAPPDSLRKLVAYAEAHPEVGMIGPRLVDGAGRYQASYRPRPTLAALLHRTRIFRCTGLFRTAYGRFRREDFDPHQPRQVETLMGAALFVSRRVFDECGPWDPDFTFGAEDLQLSACIARRHPLMFLPDVEIIHYGGVSTRQHRGYVTAHHEAGLVRYLRKAGYARPALLFYKLAVTLDAPVQLVTIGLHYLMRRAAGRSDRARKSLTAWRGVRHFLSRGLVPFWQA